MVAEQLSFAEVAPAMEYKLVKATVVKMLKRYNKLPHMIAAAERRANGHGIQRIDKKEQDRLANSTKPYLSPLSGALYKEKALTLVDQAMHAHSSVQELDELNGILVGVRTWGVEGALDHNYRVVPAARAWQEVYTLKDELDTIEFALDRLKSYAPELEKLLRLRFIDGYQVEEVAEKLLISKRTYDTRRDQAIAEFAMLVGITNG